MRRTREIKGAPWEERVEGFWLALFKDADRVEELRIITCFGGARGDHGGWMPRGVCLICGVWCNSRMLIGGCGLFSRASGKAVVRGVDCQPCPWRRSGEMRKPAWDGGLALYMGFSIPSSVNDRHIEMAFDGMAEYLRPGTMTELLHGWLIGWPVWGRLSAAAHLYEVRYPAGITHLMSPNRYLRSATWAGGRKGS